MQPLLKSELQCMDSSSLGLATIQCPNNTVLYLAGPPHPYMLDSHSPNLGFLMLFHVLFCRLNAFKRCVMIMEIKLYNKLPNKIVEMGKWGNLKES
jgi:hypothetical protein